MMDLLEAHGALPYVIIDLSIVRGLAYYTGFVYEAFEASGEGRALAGGGRYDHLLRNYPAMSICQLADLQWGHDS